MRSAAAGARIKEPVAAHGSLDGDSDVERDQELEPLANLVEDYEERHPEVVIDPDAQPRCDLAWRRRSEPLSACGSAR